MPSTNDLLPRLAVGVPHRSARRADTLTHRDFAADLAALVDTVTAKDRAIEALIEYGYVGPETPPEWMGDL